MSEFIKEVIITSPDNYMNKLFSPYKHRFQVMRKAQKLHWSYNLFVRYPTFPQLFDKKQN